jgi:tetratricopeptide (TPR) repeat protein
MAMTRVEKRKAKQKQRRVKRSLAFQKEKTDFLFNKSLWLRNQGKMEEALSYAEKALRLDPKNKEMLHEMGYLGYHMGRTDVELKSLLGLYDNGFIKNEQMPGLCILLEKEGRYEHALNIAEETLPLISKMKIRNKRMLRADIVQLQKQCKLRLKIKQKKRPAVASSPASQAHLPRKRESCEKKRHPEFRTNVVSLPEIPVSIKLDSAAFKQALAHGQFTSLERYELTLEGYRIRFKESFDNLICLNNLQDVRSFWYQEETARKVLKSFRGRALLSDEVGLGKTIEALIVFKEYIQRGMVKSALILTPTPLVSQWQGELKTKFRLDIPSTDDPDYRMKGASFWKEVKE